MAPGYQEHGQYLHAVIHSLYTYSSDAHSVPLSMLQALGSKGTSPSSLMAWQRSRVGGQII